MDDLPAKTPDQAHHPGRMQAPTGQQIMNPDAEREHVVGQVQDQERCPETLAPVAERVGGADRTAQPAREAGRAQLQDGQHHQALVRRDPLAEHEGGHAQADEADHIAQLNAEECGIAARRVEVQVVYRVSRQRSDDGEHADTKCHRNAQSPVQSRFLCADEQDLRGERDQPRDEHGRMHVQDHGIGRVVVRDMPCDFAAETEQHADPDQRNIDEKQGAVGRVGGRECTARIAWSGDCI